MASETHKNYTHKAMNNHRNDPPAGALVALARSLVERLGVAAAAKELGVSRPTLTAYLSNVPVSRGTEAILTLAWHRSNGKRRDAA
jgi:DNA-binding phage protein